MPVLFLYVVKTCQKENSCLFFQFGCWSFWICQLFLFALAVMKLYHYHRQEALPISFNRERQRLLQKVQGQSGNEYVKT